MEGFLRKGNTAEVTGPGAGPKSQGSTEFQRYDNDHNAVYLTVKFTEPPSSANTYLMEGRRLLERCQGVQLRCWRSAQAERHSADGS